VKSEVNLPTNYVQKHFYVVMFHTGDGVKQAVSDKFNVTSCSGSYSLKVIA